MDSRLRLSSIDSWRLDRAEWDKFAQVCGASFLCSSTVLRLWRLRGRVIALQFYLDGPEGTSEKIAQCGIAIVGSQRIFLDSLVIRPDRSEHWQDCFAVAVEAAGAGRYRYGSKWNIETDYPAKVLAMPGIVSTVNLMPFLDVVDFKRWATFDAYLRDVSSNIRRNLARIERLSDAVRIERYSGLGALRVIHHLAALRSAVLPRYGQRVNVILEYCGHVLKVLLFRRYACVTLVRYQRKVHAIFYGTAFGATLHYNSGATRREMNGFGAFLFVNVLRDWFRKHPDGRVILGQAVGRADPDLSHFRQKLRAQQLDGGPLDFKVS